MTQEAFPAPDAAATEARRHRVMARQLLPGAVLPALVYFAVSFVAPTLVALAAASAIPAADTVLRLAQGRRPSPAGLAFLVVSAVSVGMALWLHSPELILVRGALVSAVLGAAFGVSAVVRRPLTRTAAILLSAEHPEGRRRLAERWRHPTALSVFRALAIGWALLLLFSAGHQTALALTVSPHVFMALEPPLQLGGMVLGIAVSFAYVRKVHRVRPELGLLPRSS